MMRVLFIFWLWRGSKICWFCLNFLWSPWKKYSCHPCLIMDFPVRAPICFFIFCCLMLPERKKWWLIFLFYINFYIFLIDFIFVAYFFFTWGKDSRVSNIYHYQPPHPTHAHNCTHTHTKQKKTWNVFLTFCQVISVDIKAFY